jgi:hypothetical protein
MVMVVIIFIKKETQLIQIISMTMNGMINITTKLNKIKIIKV